MPEQGARRGEQPDREGQVMTSAGSLSLTAREALDHSLAALAECGATLSVRAIYEPADIVCTLLMRAVGLARAVRIVVERLRADGECLDDIAESVNKARQFSRSDFDGAFGSASRRFDAPRQRLFEKVATYTECDGAETWTLDPMHLENHPGWIAADEQERGAYRAIDCFQCLALSLTVLYDSIRPRAHENDFSF